MNEPKDESTLAGTVDEVEKGVAEITAMDSTIAELREKYTGVIFDVDTKDGMEAAKKARKEIRDPRYLIENTRKAAKRPIIDLGKKLDAKAAAMKDQLLEIEEPIDEAIKAEERKEEQRLAKIHKAISGIRTAVADLIVAGADSETIAKTIAELDEVNPAEFDEFEVTAVEALTTARSGLNELLLKKRQEEKDRAELEELRLQREAQERKEREEEEEKRRIAEQKEREERERIERENERLRREKADEQQKREAAERRAQNIEREKQREENERAFEEDRKAKEAEELARRSRYPGPEALMTGIAAYFKIETETARDWLFLWANGENDK